MFIGLGFCGVIFSGQTVVSLSQVDRSTAYNGRGGEKFNRPRAIFPSCSVVIRSCSVTTFTYSALLDEKRSQQSLLGHCLQTLIGAVVNLLEQAIFLIGVLGQLPGQIHQFDLL